MNTEYSDKQQFSEEMYGEAFVKLSQFIKQTKLNVSPTADLKHQRLLIEVSLNLQEMKLLDQSIDYIVFDRFLVSC